MTRTPASGRLAFWGAAAFVPLWSAGILFDALAIRHGPPFAVTGLRFAAAAARRVAGLFFLVPPVTALAAVPLLGEALTWRLALGIALGAGPVRPLQMEGRRQAPS